MDLHIAEVGPTRSASSASVEQVSSCVSPRLPRYFKRVFSTEEAGESVLKFGVAVVFISEHGHCPVGSQDAVRHGSIDVPDDGVACSEILRAAD